MCIFKDVGHFIRDGISTFRDASAGQYKQNSASISEMRKELLERNSTRSDDKKSLMKDRKNVERDLRVSYNKIVLNNG